MVKDEEEEEQEYSKVGEVTDENKEHMSSDIDDTDADEESDASVSTNVHPKARNRAVTRL
jgi:hypothetical protein